MEKNFVRLKKMKNLAQSSIYRTWLKTSVPSISFSSPFGSLGKKERSSPGVQTQNLYLEPSIWLLGSPAHDPGSDQARGSGTGGKLLSLPGATRPLSRESIPLLIPYTNHCLPSGSGAQTFAFAGPLASWTVFVVNFIAPSSWLVLSCTVSYLPGALVSPPPIEPSPLSLFTALSFP